MKRLRNVFVGLLSALSAQAFQDARAADPWPARPLKMIVPFAAGGPTDVLARSLAMELGGRLGQPVIVENRAGGGSNIGYDAMARAPADGYTILLGTGTVVTNPSLYKKLSFDPLKDFTPIALIGTTPVFVWVRNDYPAKTLPDLVRLAKEKPSAVNYGSSGPGTVAHLASLLFQDRTGTVMTHVGYKGSAQALNDMLGGVFSVQFDVPQPMAAQYRAGNLRALAALSSQRSSAFPEIPSIKEFGYEGIDASALFGLYTAAGVSGDIVGKLQQTLQTVLVSPKFKEIMAQQFVEVPAQPIQGQAFHSWLKEEIDVWHGVISKSGLSLN
jgi:tripartite-type tricarboxylate transporter receptor subunit TctC